MTLFAPHETDLLLARLEDRTLAAWDAYASAVRDLEGAAYEHAEREAWASLQADLRAIEADRAELARPIQAA